MPEVLSVLVLLGRTEQQAIGRVGTAPYVSTRRLREEYFGVIDGIGMFSCSEGHPSPRKTRFRLLAKLCRAGFVNPQGRDERFLCSSHFLLSRAFLTQRHPILALDICGTRRDNGVIELTLFTRCPISVPAIAGCGCI